MKADTFMAAPVFYNGQLKLPCWKLPAILRVYHRGTSLKRGFHLLFFPASQTIYK